jgi:hypothetical protein
MNYLLCIVLLLSCFENCHAMHEDNESLEKEMLSDYPASMFGVKSAQERSVAQGSETYITFITESNGHLSCISVERELCFHADTENTLADSPTSTQSTPSAQSNPVQPLPAPQSHPDSPINKEKKNPLRITFKRAAIKKYVCNESEHKIFTATIKYDGKMLCFFCRKPLILQPHTCDSTH